ncbi:ParB/RepB/Spo0J family partition protein [Streptomyces sp. NPDC102437]|uniref:ParB/RepB/Spo0J family partition protein n=1 Tax=Streptomyces sp. NPDC102437 TaxID=3366175 RepID=UPI0038112BB7
MSKKDDVPRYQSEETRPDEPSRNDILNHYGLAAGVESDEDREMREWEEAQAARLGASDTRTGRVSSVGAAAVVSAHFRVSVADLSPNPDNPRGDIDPNDPEFQGLKKSVSSIGVAQALTVCTREAFVARHPQHAEAVNRRYVVVAGHRRLHAAWLAGCEDVPVLVNDDAAENPLVWAVAENLQRVGLNAMQEARTLSVLTLKPPAGQGLSQTVVASGIGKTQGFVSQRVALLKLTPSLQELVLAGKLKVKRAALLAKLPSDEQEAAEEALHSLVPALQSELDGGKLNDIHLALRVAGLPRARQLEARANKGEVPVPDAGPASVEGPGTGLESAAAPGIPVQQDSTTVAATIGNGLEKPVVTLHTPAQIADDLARYLPSDDLTQLTELLLERTTEARTITE